MKCRNRPSLGLLAAVVLGGGTAMAGAGCQSSGSTTRITVSVRDRATRQPVPAALVDPRTEHFYLPLPPYSILDPSPPEQGCAVTGDDGTATLEVLDEHPVRLLVIAPGYELLAVSLDDVLDLDPPPWLHGEEVPGGDAAPQLEVRLDRSRP